MTRMCHYGKTTTKYGCMNLVSDLGDHCAAGHPCPPISSVSGPPEEALEYVHAPELETDALANAAVCAYSVDPRLKVAESEAIKPQSPAEIFAVLAESGHYGPRYIVATVPKESISAAKLFVAELPGSIVKAFGEASPEETDVMGLIYVAGPNLLRAGQ